MQPTEQTKKRYLEWVKEASPNSRLAFNCLRAFLAGGAICAVGQLIKNFILARGATADTANLLTAVTLITVAILLTGMGWYSKIAEHACAGSVVPITGFANAIAAPAIEHKKEGFILGVGAKMFIIAGPVILYGTLASVAVGLIYYFTKTG
jgi:stage V sporulation protein AC